MNSLLDGCTQESRDLLDSKISHQQQVYVEFILLNIYFDVNILSPFLNINSKKKKENRKWEKRDNPLICLTFRQKIGMLIINGGGAYFLNRKTFVDIRRYSLAKGL